MNENISLSELQPGCSAVVRALTLSGDIRRRLQDIGVIEGTVIEPVAKSPLGDPTAYLICGATIALRDTDSSGVLVEPI